MITVVVDRDSVAMGDDVSSHVETWELDDDARLGDVVVQMIERNYLASVAGSVAWRIDVRPAARLRRDADDVPESIAYERDAVRRPLVMLFVEPVRGAGPRITVSTLAHDGTRRRIVDALEPTERGEYVFHAVYLSGGALAEWDAFRSSVLQTDEEEQAELRAFRARAYPGLYDENGERRR